jgi:hypothetical protein
MIGSGFIKNLISGKGSEIITSVGEVADKFITTKQEKEEFNAEIQKEVNRHLEAMTAETNKEIQMYLNDVADAREMNTKIQDSDKASWLSKNIAYCLDIVFVSAFIFMLVLIFLRAVPEANKELFYTGFGLLGGYVGTVINFHRGTSRGSENKQKQLDKMLK